MASARSALRPLLGERTDVRHRVVANLAAQDLVSLAARGEGDRRGRADVRARRHHRDVAGEGDEQAGGRRPRPARGDVSDDGHRRSEDVAHDGAHRGVEPAGGVDAQDDERRPGLPGVPERLGDPRRRGRVDRACELDGDRRGAVVLGEGGRPEEAEPGEPGEGEQGPPPGPSMRGAPAHRLGDDESPADGVAGELDPVVHPQLLEDVRPVALDCLAADHERLGDLLVRVGLRDEA